VKTYYNLDVTPCGDNITAVAQQTENTNSPNVFPNPASSQIQIHTSNAITQPYSIYDMTGQLLQMGMTSGNETIVNVTELPEGIYFIRVGKNEMMQTLKFVKTQE